LAIRISSNSQNYTECRRSDVIADADHRISAF